MAHVITPISRLLIANRGEIARRINRTAQAMGISTVAIYADGDANAPFVQEADSAIALNGITTGQTYLDVAKVLAAAHRSEADAIHPGYGFLSENQAFAQAVIDAGVKWLGPSPEVIGLMGDKLSAKRLMDEAGVPTLPGVEITEDIDIAAAAKEIGYPVLVKASAGGGGRGMRVVDTESDLLAAVESAKREAGTSFGDDTVFLEKWLATSRHIEIQILGDNHGNLVHCYERECSIQRRHQKIIEEAPSPAVDDSLRSRMGDAAIAAARKLGYASAGTVEFLLGDNDDFYFLEVNARLQVEHPVTEEIIGQDLVREQIRVAEGETMEQAIIGGACDRLRPVMLTSITTIVGLTPLLFETSLQAQFLIPMALTIVFGLATASVLVLFVIPALLAALEDIAAGKARLHRWWRPEHYIEGGD